MKFMRAEPTDWQFFRDTHPESDYLTTIIEVGPDKVKVAQGDLEWRSLYPGCDQIRIDGIVYTGPEGGHLSKFKRDPGD